ncbi:MAG: patatin-like phospholipase family protein [Nitrospirota bacterium]
MKNFFVGLALGGGGARGSAHLGIIKVLEDAHIPIDIITGSSFGAIVGAMYAINPNAEVVKNKILSFLNSSKFKRTTIHFLKRYFKEVDEKRGLINNLRSYVRKGFFYGISLTKGSFISEGDFLDNICNLVDDIDIEDTKIPFSCVAADIIEGEEVILSKGSLRKAICASCAIPGVFSPIIYQGKQLIDGGWVDEVPIVPAIKQGADVVIAVSASFVLESSDILKSGLDILIRSNNITRNVLNDIQLKKSDVVITPDIGHINWTDFNKAYECIEKGERAARLKVEDIKRVIRHKKLKRIILGKKKEEELVL